ncbi:hypothetical protein SCANM63S_03500 [Streptomyces canarius]
MGGGDLELGQLLAAAEAAPPGESVEVVANDLRKRFGAERVSFLFVDLVGHRLLRLVTQADDDGGAAERIDLEGSVYDAVLRSQRQHVEPDGLGGRRVISPVTNRGDCIGLLEATLQNADDTVLAQIGDAAHALAYIIVTDRRFTDRYHAGRRTTRTSAGRRDPAPTASLGLLLRGSPVHPRRGAGAGRRHRRGHIRLHARPRHTAPVHHRRHGARHPLRAARHASGRRSARRPPQRL